MNISEAKIQVGKHPDQYIVLTSTVLEWIDHIQLFKTPRKAGATLTWKEEPKLSDDKVEVHILWLNGERAARDLIDGYRLFRRQERGSPTTFYWAP